MQRAIVVTAEKRMVEQGKGRDLSREKEVSLIFFGVCFWKHKPSFCRDRAKMCFPWYRVRKHSEKH